MLDLIVKIKTSLKLIEQEKGNFKIKCLVAKDLSNLQWDLVLSADWFDSDIFKRLDYLSEKILSDFDIDCMMQFSGIVTYESHISNPLIKLLEAIQNNQKRGKYDDLGQGYVIVQPHHQAAQWIIPLNEPDALPIPQNNAASYNLERNH